MNDPIPAYPLSWPIGRPRTQHPQRSRFEITLGSAIKEIQGEVQRLGGSNLVISSNLHLRQDGIPYASQTQPKDCGVAVYFNLRRKARVQSMCFACDRWVHIEDNLHAISLTVEALRGIERWGSGEMLEQAFTGFVALPSPEIPWQVLGLTSSSPTREEVENAYKRKAAQHHPDRGGTTSEMTRINEARDKLYKQMGWA